MNNQKIAIICDSGCDLPENYAAKHDIYIAPLTLNYSDGSYLSDIDITTDEVIDRFAEEIPHTSLPSPMTIKKCFDQARANGYTKAVCITVSSALSATNQTAHMVANTIEDFPIIIIDSKSAAGGAGLVVMAAVEMIEEGIDFEELKYRLNKVRDETFIFVAMKSLDFIHEGGRLSDAAYKIASTLKLNPVLMCSKEGKAAIAKKARGYKKAIKAEILLLNDCVCNFSEVRLAICGTKRTHAFDDIKEQLYKSFTTNISEVVKSDISAGMVVHSGPDVLALAAQPNWRNL